MTRRAYGTGSIVHRRSGEHEGRYEFRLTVNGARHSASFPQRPTREQQKAKVREWSAPSSPSPDPESVGDYLERWVRDGLPDARARTRNGYRALIRDHLAAISDVPLAELTAPEVQRVINAVQARRSPRTAAHVLACLRAGLAQAVRWGVLDRNVAASVKAPRVAATSPLTLSPEETRRFLAQVRGDPLEAMFVLAAMTGMRQGEVLGLSWPDVDLAGASLTINGSLWWRPARQGEDMRQPVVTDPKTPRSRRTLHLQPELLALLRTHRKRQLDSEREVDEGLVFTDARGVALQPTVVLNRFKRHLAAAHLPPVRFHALRHGAASMLLADGVPVNLVSELLGHSSASTTLNIYGHVLETAHKEVAARMGSLLRVEIPADTGVAKGVAEP